MIARSAMSSFSDAHELVEIPIIAANLHYLMLPRQLQIWAVLRTSDSPQRLVYSLAATFLGRMCLSGDITELNDDQWKIIHASLRLYRRAVPIIKLGVSRRFGDRGPSWRHPRGWQAVRRISADGNSALIVLHSFARSPSSVRIPLSDGSWRVTSKLSADSTIKVFQDGLEWTPAGDFSGAVALLERHRNDPSV